MLFQSTLIFITSLILIGLVKKYAPTLGLIDNPNQRSVHFKPIARGAGIGFYLAVLVVLPMFNVSSLLLYKYTYIGTFTIFIAGVLDDYRGITSNLKFFVIIISTVLLSFDNIIISTLGVYFGFELSLGWFALPFTILAVVVFPTPLGPANT
jgi:UDP-GlcNAc:undecaprenyl-phosphate GlcNAc-1-phosphate transferase